MTWLVGRPFGFNRTLVVLLLLFGAMITGTVAQEAGTGSLVLQSPVQAVASINGQGTFLLIPGKDLRWGQIRPGNYEVAVRSGAGQQWQRQVQIQPGQTATLVAALSSAGIPLDAGVAPPLPDTGSGLAPAYVPPPSESPSVPSLSPPPPSTPSTAQRDDDRDAREAERRRQEQEQADRLAEKRRRDAETRALRAAQRREREAQEAEEKSNRRRRPKVH